MSLTVFLSSFCFCVSLFGFLFNEKRNYTATQIMLFLALLSQAILIARYFD